MFCHDLMKYTFFDVLTNYYAITYKDVLKSYLSGSKITLKFS